MSTVSSNPKEDVDRLYADVSDSIAAAMAEIDLLAIDHKDGKQKIGDILAGLAAMQAQFDDELGMLQEHAEWDKFTIAFFGETNAGKSTIIESLRILFDEQSRRQLIAQNESDLWQFEAALQGHIDTVRQGLLDAQSACAKAIEDLRRELEARSADLLNDTEERGERYRREIAGVQQTLQEQDAANRDLATRLAGAQRDQDLASQRFEEALAAGGRRAWLLAATACAAGAAAVLLIQAALG